MHLKGITPDKVSRDETTGMWSIEGLPSANTYETMIEDLRANIPFSYFRAGDGEWNAVFGVQGQNCDNHKYFPEMGKLIGEVILSNPDYIMGLQPLSVKHKWQEIYNFCGHLNIDWVNSDVLHDANITEHLKRFFEVLKGQPVIMIAPQRLQKLPFSYSRFIEIPLINCWTERDRVVNELLDLLPKVDYAVLLFCASMSTNVMIHDLYKYYGDKVTMIDCGSIFDPHCNYQTRSYHKKMEL